MYSPHTCNTHTRNIGGGHILQLVKHVGKTMAPILRSHIFGHSEFLVPYSVLTLPSANHRARSHIPAVFQLSSPRVQQCQHILPRSIRGKLKTEESILCSSSQPLSMSARYSSDHPNPSSRAPQTPNYNNIFPADDTNLLGAIAN